VSEVFVATLDLKTGRLVDKPSPVSQQIVAARTLAGWSPDGSHLTYLTRREPTVSGSTITIRTISSGEERDIPIPISPVRQLGWFPDGSALVVPGLDANRKPTVSRVDIKSGVATTIVQRDDMAIGQASVTRDGRSLVYFGYTKDTSLVVVRDLLTGQERVLTKSPAATGMAVSVEGKLVAVTMTADGMGGAALAVIPVAGGEPREILHVEQGRSIPASGYPIWTPDGSRILCRFALQDKSESGIFLVPVDGGEPVKMPPR
jgi:Tol biopolymer transport system component